ncbi:MAG: hypothetical protein R6W86_16880 [Marinobacter sp.]|uniref:hypothetical protein n=1 Tax=Marinobacter sp. TaxID=50741 RepID=UPI00396E4F22
MATVNAVGYVGEDNHRRFLWLVAFCLLGMAVSALLVSLERTAAQAERQSVQLMLNQLRSALVVKGAEVMLTGGRLEDWQGLNPVNLLQSAPMNWGGDCSGAEHRKGIWCFSRDDRVLVYRSRWAEFPGIDGGPEQAEWLFWRVEPEFTRPARIPERRAGGLVLNRVNFDQRKLY